VSGAAEIVYGVPLQAEQSPEMWAFGVSNAVVFALLLSLGLIAYRAYRREEGAAFLLASAGFSLLAVGSAIESIYEFGLNDGYQAFGRELYLLRIAESALLALGVVVLLVSLNRVGR
jgi:hypothetical protein